MDTLLSALRVDEYTDTIYLGEELHYWETLTEIGIRPANSMLVRIGDIQQYKAAQIVDRIKERRMKMQGGVAKLKTLLKMSQKAETDAELEESRKRIRRHIEERIQDSPT